MLYNIEVPCRYMELQGIYGDIVAIGGYSGLQQATWGYRGYNRLCGATIGYRGLHGAIWGHRGYMGLQRLQQATWGLQQATWGYRGYMVLQGDIGARVGYMGLQQATWGHRGLQQATWECRGYMGLQGLQQALLQIEVLFHHYSFKTILTLLIFTLVIKCSGNFN